eukprot:15458023-Alexandrium_andersonii.AAC.1
MKKLRMFSESSVGTAAARMNPLAESPSGPTPSWTRARSEPRRRPEKSTPRPHFVPPPRATSNGDG